MCMYNAEGVADRSHGMLLIICFEFKTSYVKNDVERAKEEDVMYL